MEECTIERYEVGASFFRCNQTKPFEIDKNREQKGDWSSSIYFFLKKEDLKNYNEEDHPFPMEFKNNVSLPYIKCTYECFKQLDYNEKMPEIIANIERLLNIQKPEEMPFMKWLGSYGYAFQCFNADTEEIAIPFPFFEDLNDWEITDS